MSMKLIVVKYSCILNIKSGVPDKYWGKWRAPDQLTLGRMYPQLGLFSGTEQNDVAMVDWLSSFSEFHTFTVKPEKEWVQASKQIAGKLNLMTLNGIGY